MRRPEQRLWDRMRTHLQARELRLERVENAVGEGISDVLVAGRCLETRRLLVTWAELKAVESAPARATTPLLGADKGLRLSQRNWLREWSDWGGRSVIVIGVGSREHLAVPGWLCDEVNAMTHEELRAAAVATDWGRLALWFRTEKVR